MCYYLKIVVLSLVDSEVVRAAHEKCDDGYNCRDNNSDHFPIYKIGQVWIFRDIRTAFLCWGKRPRNITIRPSDFYKAFSFKGSQ